MLGALRSLHAARILLLAVAHESYERQKQKDTDASQAGEQEECEEREQ